MSARHDYIVELEGFALDLAHTTGGIAEAYFRKKDDGRIVIDEFVGQWITLYLIPISAATVIAAFFFFRISDI
ncbi:MAG: phosphatidylglycerophosphatase A, partial [Gammaproteobacteria bacterium]